MIADIVRVARAEDVQYTVFMNALHPLRPESFVERAVREMRVEWRQRQAHHEGSNE